MSGYFVLVLTTTLAVAALGAAIGTLAAKFMLFLLRRFGTGELLRNNPAVSFWLRLLPWVSAIAFAVGLALPAFLIFEPRQTTERPELSLLCLSTAAGVIASIIAFRAVRDLIASERLTRLLRCNAIPLRSVQGVPVFVVDRPASLLAVVGVINPRIFVGRELARSLSARELKAALAHEVSHVHSHDNLKRLLLSATSLPSLRRQLVQLDEVWAKAAECAADRQALQGGTSALDLGAAIVKVMRLNAEHPQNEFWAAAAVCHLVATIDDSAIALRVEQLRRAISGTSHRSSRPKGLGLAPLIAAICYLFALPSLLAITHRVVEWLVR